MVAVMNRRYKDVVYLMNIPDISLNIVEYYEKTALVYAVENHDSEMSSLLINNTSIDVNLGKPLLLSAAPFLVQNEITKQLLDRPDLNSNPATDLYIEHSELGPRGLDKTQEAWFNIAARLDCDNLSRTIYHGNEEGWKRQPWRRLSRNYFRDLVSMKGVLIANDDHKAGFGTNKSWGFHTLAYESLPGSMGLASWLQKPEESNPSKLPYFDIVHSARSLIDDCTYVIETAKALAEAGKIRLLDEHMHSPRHRAQGVSGIRLLFIPLDVSVSQVAYTGRDHCDKPYNVIATAWIFKLLELSPRICLPHSLALSTMYAVLCFAHSGLHRRRSATGEVVFEMDWLEVVCRPDRKKWLQAEFKFSLSRRSSTSHSSIQTGAASSISYQCGETWT
ncbi:hypothetical protein CC86DRAFT_377547 [Ophiobolus disseminans]|uniref:Uncharacterized protein n=1 Tax=Ophiobolus disseminans TaxID=1469910 RepID=A0A6A7AI74_9PLEO|nr:hypothetical protein CC86DRAFT_377547 [Ophiobolus disseminans]